MTATQTDYGQYEGKKVIITRNLSDGTAVEVEGTVQTGNVIGLLLKPKGKSTIDLIEAGDIEQIIEQAETPKPLTRKVLKPITFGNARTHLLERHSVTLTEINGMDEQTALEMHDSIDHEADDLGHIHKQPEEEEAAA
jgi:hypothetical protein